VRPGTVALEGSEKQKDLLNDSRILGQLEIFFIIWVASEGISHVVDSKVPGCNVVPKPTESLSIETISASLYMHTKLQTFKAWIWFQVGAGLAMN
jgi:hypothetical protein